MPIWQDSYMRLEIEPAKHLVRQTRTSQIYESTLALQQHIDALVEQMQSIERSEYVLLQDLRAVRGRNDPEFESVMAQGRVKISHGFRKVAVLVATSVGKLQVQRYIERDNLVAGAYLDEKAAMRWLLE